MTECYPEKQYVWFSGAYTSDANGVRFNNMSPCNNYGGIIVIHNENFDPDQWEATCPGGVVAGHAYCTAANAPAVFDMNGDVQWTGIVIADQVVKVNGTPTSPRRHHLARLRRGDPLGHQRQHRHPIQLRGVMGATNQGYKTRLGWRRLR